MYTMHNFSLDYLYNLPIAFFPILCYTVLTVRKEVIKIIYCGYQGCGKTTYCNSHPDTTIDLDSSMFVKFQGWEKGYVCIASHLSNLGKNVFISAHKQVIEYLIASQIPFELLIPAQNPKAWRNRLEFRYNINPTQGNLNALLDFDKNFESDMAFYDSLTCVKHYISAKVTTNISDFI